MTEKIIIGVTAFVAGLTGGYILAKKALEAFYENQYQEDKASLNAHVRKKIKEGVDKELKALGYIPGTTIDPETNQPARSMDRSSLGGVYRQNPYEEVKQNYNIAAEVEVEPDYDSDEWDNDDELTDAAGMTEEDMRVRDLSEIDRTNPYMISDEEYIDEFEDHAKIPIFYYREDDVLCEENTEVITHVGGTVGVEAISVLASEDIVYVRNEPLCIDYEITAFDSSFEEMMKEVSNNLSPSEAYARRKAEGKNH